MKFIKNLILATLKEFFEQRDLVQSKETAHTFDVSVAPSVQAGINHKERKLLEELAQNTDFISVIHKFEYSLALGSVNCRDLHDIAEIRGGQKVLKLLSDELRKSAPKSAFNPLTGE